MTAAAYRSYLHWSELVGGDIILTIPPEWQRKLNASKLPVKQRIDEPVPAPILAELNELEEFRRAFEPDGMAPSVFDDFGATRRTLRAFLSSYYELLSFVRDLRLPDPDV
jgi:transaldolase